MTPDPLALHDNNVVRCFACLLLVCLAALVCSAQAEERVAAGLVVLYDFEDGAGTTIRDRATAAPPLDLQIETPHTVH